MGESSCKKDRSPENAQAKEKLRLRMKKIIEDAKAIPDGNRKAFSLFGLGHTVIPLEFGYIKDKEAKAMLSAMEILNQK